MCQWVHAVVAFHRSAASAPGRPRSPMRARAAARNRSPARTRSPRRGQSPKRLRSPIRARAKPKVPHTRTCWTFGLRAYALPQNEVVNLFHTAAHYTYQSAFCFVYLCLLPLAECTAAGQRASGRPTLPTQQEVAGCGGECALAPAMFARVPSVRH